MSLSLEGILVRRRGEKRLGNRLKIQIEPRYVREEGDLRIFQREALEAIKDSSQEKEGIGEEYESFKYISAIMWI